MHLPCHRARYLPLLTLPDPNKYQVLFNHPVNISLCALLPLPSLSFLVRVTINLPLDYYNTLPLVSLPPFLPVYFFILIAATDTLGRRHNRTAPLLHTLHWLSVVLGVKSSGFVDPISPAPYAPSLLLFSLAR